MTLATLAPNPTTLRYLENTYQFTGQATVLQVVPNSTNDPSLHTVYLD